MNTDPNVVNTRVVYDSGDKTVLQMIGYYTAITTGNTIVLDPKTLQYANTSQICTLMCEKIQYHSSLTGSLFMEWQGASRNSAFFIAGVGSGKQEFPIYNDAATPSGNVNVRMLNASPNDSFTIVATFKKVEGFANSAAWFGG